MTMSSYIIGSLSGTRSSSLKTGLSEFFTTRVLIAACPGSLTLTKASVEPYASMIGSPSMR